MRTLLGQIEIPPPKWVSTIGKMNFMTQIVIFNEKWNKNTFLKIGNYIDILKNRLYLNCLQRQEMNNNQPFESDSKNSL